MNSEYGDAEREDAPKRDVYEWHVLQEDPLPQEAAAYLLSIGWTYWEFAQLPGKRLMRPPKR